MGGRPGRRQGLGHIIGLLLLLLRALLLLLLVRRQGERGRLEPPRDLAVHAQPRVDLLRVPALDLRGGWVGWGIGVGWLVDGVDRGGAGLEALATPIEKVLSSERLSLDGMQSVWHP